MPIYDFIISAAFEKYKGTDALSKKKISAEVVPFLGSIENPIIFSHYLKLLAKRLDVSEESVEISVRQFQKKQTVATDTTSFTPAKKLRDVLLEEYLLALIIQGEEKQESLSTVLNILTVDDLNQPAVAKIVEQLSLFFKTHKEFDVKKFGALLSAEIAPSFDKALLLDLENILKDTKIYNKELACSAYEIKKNSLRRRINNISTKIKEKEAKGDESQTQTLQQNLRVLIQNLKEVDKLASKD